MKSILFLLFSLLFTMLKGARHRRNVKQEAKQSVCYDHLGCFDNLSPFKSDMPLPMSPSKIKTEYYLRTRRNLIKDQPIIPEALNISSSNFDATKPTKIIIHGFVMVNSGLAKWVPEITDAILFQEDVNVIQINWVKGANVEYDNAASNTRIVGAQVGFLINLLMEVKQAKARDFHIIGFSLGAHVAGFAGKMVKSNGRKRKVGRITGLDPANPGFNYDSPLVRLDKSDAKFVDIIHTDTKTVLVIASGMNRNLGHVDFYPNGGADQTGCNSWHKGSSWMSAITDSTVCDHLRAPELFKASINATGSHPRMIGYRCKNFTRFKRGVCVRCRGLDGCREMGYWAKPLTARRKQMQYFLVTSAEKPFTVKDYQVQIHWRNSDVATKAGFKAKLFLTLHGSKGSTSEIALNDDATFHVHAGRTTRFLITVDTENEIGAIQKVVFRWERPSCYAWFLCSRENVNLKRIKIFDATEQRRSVYLPLGKDRSERIHSHSVKPGEEFELLSSTYIRSLYPNRRYTSLRKEEEALIRPKIVRVQGKPSKFVQLSTTSPTSSRSSL